MEASGPSLLVMLSALDIGRDGNSSLNDVINNMEPANSSQLNSITFVNSDEIRDIAPHGDRRLDSEVVNDVKHFDLQSNDAYGAELERTEHRGYENILEDI